MAGRVVCIALVGLGSAFAHEACEAKDGVGSTCATRLEDEATLTGSFVQMQHDLVQGKSSTDTSSAKAGAVHRRKLKKKPHILFILADDLGYNDLGFRQNKASPVNPQGLPTMGEVAKTPVIDRLSTESVVLQTYYTHSTCSPSRAALMTGRYPFRTGMGPYPVGTGMPFGLPGSEKTLADVLFGAGYATHMVGKWHLGNGDERWTPTFRGFESFFGFLGGSEDYFEHTEAGGLDFRSSSLDSKNVLPNNTNRFQGEYSTKIMSKRVKHILKEHVNNGETRPMFLYVSLQTLHGAHVQVPDQYKKLYQGSQFEDEDGLRIQKGLAVASAMDDAVASIEKAFKKHSMWDDTILVFSSDNGGGPQASSDSKKSPFGKEWPGGSSFPLRGYKTHDWEGGIRGTAFVRGTAEWPIVSGETHAMIHISDWFPTLAHVAGASLDASVPLDGHNVWGVLADGANATRTSIVFDCPWKDGGESASEAAVQTGRAGALRRGPLKFMYASTAVRSSTNQEAQHTQLKFTDDALMCDCPDPIDGKYLFDIESDPTECTNLAGDAEYADAMSEMETELETCSQESAQGLFEHFASAGFRAWMANKQHTLVFDDELQMKVWKEWDCGQVYPEICGWPMR